MKKLALIFFTILGLTFPMAQAQTPNKDVPLLDLVILMSGVCGNAQEIRDALRTEYTEMPMAGGIGGIRLADGEIVAAHIRIYISLETYNFSILAEFEDGIGCIITRGTNFGPIIQEKSI